MDKCKVEYEGTIARWLPKDPAVIRDYHHKLLSELVSSGIIIPASGDVDEIDKVKEEQLSLVILEFKKVIEEDAEIFRDFHEMFDEVALNRKREEEEKKNEEKQVEKKYEVSE